MTHVLRARRLLTEEGWLDDHQLRIADVSSQQSNRFQWA